MLHSEIEMDNTSDNWIAINGFTNHSGERITPIHRHCYCHAEFRRSVPTIIPSDVVKSTASQRPKGKWNRSDNTVEH